MRDETFSNESYSSCVVWRWLDGAFVLYQYVFGLAKVEHLPDHVSYYDGMYEYKIVLLRKDTSSREGYW